MSFKMKNTSLSQKRKEITILIRLIIYRSTVELRKEKSKWAPKKTISSLKDYQKENMKLIGFKLVWLSNTQKKMLLLLQKSQMRKQKTVTLLLHVFPI